MNAVLVFEETLILAAHHMSLLAVTTMTKRIGIAVLLTVVVAISAYGDRVRRLGVDDAEFIEIELEGMGVASDMASVLAAASSHHDAIARILAVRLLGYRPGLKSETMLRQLVDDPTSTERGEAALALIRLGHVDAVENAIELMTAAEDPLFLAGQLAKFGEFRGYPHVMAAAVSEDQSLRFRSAASLVWFLIAGFEAALGQPSPQDLVLNLLKDESSKVRAEVILRLSLGGAQRLDRQPYVQQIRRLAEDDPSPKVREEARRWLSDRSRASG